MPLKKLIQTNIIFLVLLSSLCFATDESRSSFWLAQQTGEKLKRFPGLPQHSLELDDIRNLLFDYSYVHLHEAVVDKKVSIYERDERIREVFENFLDAHFDYYQDEHQYQMKMVHFFSLLAAIYSRVEISKATLTTMLNVIDKMYYAQETIATWMLFNTSDNLEMMVLNNFYMNSQEESNATCEDIFSIYSLKDYSEDFRVWGSTEEGCK